MHIKILKNNKLSIALSRFSNAEPKSGVQKFSQQDRITTFDWFSNDLPYCSHYVSCQDFSFFLLLANIFYFNLPLPFVYHKAVLYLMQQGYSLRTFTGHSASVMSLDFHPNKEDLICSCDGDGEVRYWSINNGSCVRVFKVSSHVLIYYRYFL
jgi:hypothetical protein